MEDKNSILEVLKLLPHRYPFLLVDKIVTCDPGHKITVLKNVTYNEPFFNGHFPNYPVMPGVLILEAMAQASGLLVFKTPGLTPIKESVYLFVGIDKARFKKQVDPGDQLIIQVEMLKKKQGFAIFKATGLVDNDIVASANLMCGFKELPESVKK